MVEGKKLPSIKEAERIFAQALTASCKTGLDETESFRLQVVADLAQSCKAVAIGYFGYYFVGQKVGGLVS